MIYFDNASTTRPFPEVVEKIQQTLTSHYGNPSSTHSLGRSAKSLIENARKNIAKWLNVNASELIFTSGGTEANNMILRSAVRDLGVKTIITSKIEHHAVLHCVEHLQREYDIDILYVQLSEVGDVDLHDLEYLLQRTENQKVLVSLMHVNNEIGNMLPITKVGELCKTYNAYFHSDTVQSIGHFPLDLKAFPIDFITASAHKFHGTKGIGFAYVRKGIPLRGLIFGGEQEKGMRSGTENLHNIVAMETALNESYKNLTTSTEHIKSIKKHFIESVRKYFPEAKFNGNSGNMESSSYTILNVAFPFSADKGVTLLFTLDLKGVACSKGSACQSGSVQNSHVLSAFLSEEQLKMPSLRFSFSVYNTKDEVDKVINILREIQK
ncbi:cysteine desulfurase [Capnocytophaga canis]|uniref:cysteine desulfurase family protein n=1 Tax=Capnocytophaga canis TaxID=1848903 RepID=UPI001ACD8D5C|nr:cysteine desulfurase family protein [Capnocytophaga canis]GIM60195.1 cysteine desulfurase [Capnocytophaga canis]